MTLTELHDRIHELMAEDLGGCEVQIHAMTGRLTCNSNVGVTHIAEGFDWGKNRVIITPAETLIEAKCAEKLFKKGGPEMLTRKETRKAPKKEKT